MYSFGVIQVPTTTKRAAAAPGYAYVPDLGRQQPSASVSANVPQQTKRRAARALNNTATGSEYSAKQDAKIARELAALDREPGAGAGIVVAKRSGDTAAGRAQQNKTTPAIRKILQSQKTFANHLADYEALLAQNSSSHAAAPSHVASLHGASSGGATPVSSVTGTLGGRRRSEPSTRDTTPSGVEKRSRGRRSSKGHAKNRPDENTTDKTKKESGDDGDDDDVVMLDVAPPSPAEATATSTLLRPIATKPPPPHPGDNDPLLKSRVPALPTDAELQALLQVPPLNYHEARGNWTEDDQRRPTRKFCEICGYWGRVRCKACGSRVCALDCLTTHQSDCMGGRYTG